MRINVLTIDNATLKVYRHSGFSNVILNSFTTPSTSPLGVSFDGLNVLTVDDAIDRVYRHSGFSNVILNSFTPPSTSPLGVSFDGLNVLTTDNSTDKAYKHSGFSSTVINSFVTPSTSSTGISFDGLNVLTTDNSTDRVYKHSGFSDTIINSFSSVDDVLFGISFDGLNVLTVDNSTDRVYKHSGFSDTIINSFSSPSTSPTGISQEITISSSDCIELNNGDLLVSYNSGQGSTNYDAISRRFDLSENTWLTAVTVDSGNTGYTHPAIVQLESTAASPNRILFAMRDKAASTINIYFSDDNGNTYTSLATISSVDLDENNRISLIKSGSSIGLAYHRGRTCYARLSSDEGKNWGTENTIASDGIYPDLGLLSSGNFVAAYEKYDITNNIFGRVYVNSSVDGTTWNEQAANILTDANERYTRPSITFNTEDDSLYVVTQDIATKDLRISESTDDGLTWSSVEKINPLSTADNRQFNKITSPFNFGLFSPSICQYHEKLLVLAEVWDGTNGHIVTLKRNTWRNVTESVVSENAYNPILGTPDKLAWNVINNDGSITNNSGVLTVSTTLAADNHSFTLDIPENKRITDGFKCKFEYTVVSGGSTTDKDIIFRPIVNEDTLAADIEIRFSTTALQVYDNNVGANVSGGDFTHDLTEKHEYLISMQGGVISLWIRNSHDREIKWTNILSNATITTSQSLKSSNLLSVNDAKNRILKHSGFSRTITDSFSSLSTNNAGLTWGYNDKRNVLIHCDNARDGIFLYSGFSSTIIDSFSTGGTLPIGLTFTGTDIIETDDTKNRILVHSGFTSTIKNSFSSPSTGTRPLGLAYDGNNLFISDAGTDKIYKISSLDRDTVLDSFTVAGLVPRDLTYDGTNIYLAHQTLEKIFKFSGFSKTVLDSFTIATNAAAGITFELNVSQIEFGIFSNAATLKVHSINYVMDDDGLSDGFTDPDDLTARLFSSTSVSQFLLDGIEIIASGLNGQVDDQWTISAKHDFPKESLVDDSPTNEWRSTTDSTAVNIVFDAGVNNFFEVDQINLIATNFRTGSIQMNDTDSWGSPTVDEAFTYSNKVSSSVTGVQETSITDTSQNWRKNQFAEPSKPSYVRITSGTASGNTYKIVSNTSDKLIFEDVTISTDGVAATDTYVIHGDRLTDQITAASHRYLRIVIDSQDTAEGYYKIGKALFEKKIQLTKFPSINFIRERIKNTFTTKFDSGQQIIGKKGESRETFTYNFNNKNIAAVQELEDFLDEIGWDENPFVFIHNQDSDLDDFILARIVNPFRYNHVIGNIYSLPSFRIVEEL